MTDSFDNFQIDLASETKPAGRYDKLHQAGMATRFVKGASGNPSGRSKGRQLEGSVKELVQSLRDRLDRV